MKKDPLPPKEWWKIAQFWMVLGFVMVVLVGIVLGPICPPDCGSVAITGAALQTSRLIGECLQKYAHDHNGRYPEGKTSTEVFQELLDGNYFSDPSIFYFEYLHIPGKVPPSTSHLRAENVCWDVTCCIDSMAPDKLPIVFLTGYRITYQENAPAIPLVPPLLPPPRTWSQWWTNSYHPKVLFNAVYYKDNDARVIRAENDGVILNFIPAGFDAKGKTYRQLTP